MLTGFGFKEWREKNIILSKKILELKSMVEVNGLADCDDQVQETQSKIMYYSSILEQRISEIEQADVAQGLYTDRSAKPCPVKLTTYAGLISEDFITFRDKFMKEAEDNRFPGTTRPRSFARFSLASLWPTFPQKASGISSMPGNTLRRNLVTGTPASTSKNVMLKRRLTGILTTRLQSMPA